MGTGLVRNFGSVEDHIQARAICGAVSWWRHQMETFFALLALCEGNPSVTGGFPSQRPVTRNFDVFFDVRLSKRLNKQSRCRWFETPLCSLWRHCNVHPQFRHTNPGHIIYIGFISLAKYRYVINMSKSILTSPGILQHKTSDHNQENVQE